MSKRTSWRIIPANRLFYVQDHAGNTFCTYKSLTTAQEVCDELNAMAATLSTDFSKASQGVKFTTKRRMNDIMKEVRDEHVVPYGL